MVLTAEITLYPFQDTYIPAIQTTIEHLNSFNGVQVKTFPTATILMGEHDQVMDAIKDTVAWSYREFGKCVFIVKFIPGYEALEPQPDVSESTP